MASTTPPSLPGHQRDHPARTVTPAHHCRRQGWNHRDPHDISRIPTGRSDPGGHGGGPGHRPAVAGPVVGVADRRGRHLDHGGDVGGDQPPRSPGADLPAFAVPSGRAPGVCQPGVGGVPAGAVGSPRGPGVADHGPVRFQHGRQRGPGDGHDAPADPRQCHGCGGAGWPAGIPGAGRVHPPGHGGQPAGWRVRPADPP